MQTAILDVNIERADLPIELSGRGEIYKARLEKTLTHPRVPCLNGVIWSPRSSLRGIRHGREMRTVFISFIQICILFPTSIRPSYSAFRISNALCLSPLIVLSCEEARTGSGVRENMAARHKSWESLNHFGVLMLSE